MWKTKARVSVRPICIDYLNVVMQCLYASRLLVTSYLNAQNEMWVQTPYNRRLKDFFIAYREGAEPFNPLPFVEEALVIEHQSFDYLQDRDPSEALLQLFSSFFFSQCEVVRNLNKPSTSSTVSLSETMLGKQICTLIYQSRNTCRHPYL